MCTSSPETGKDSGKGNTKRAPGKGFGRTGIFSFTPFIPDKKG
jgi:hypothetical protein